MRMERRAGLTGLWIAAVLVAAPASAQIVQSVQLGVGSFMPRGFDSRDRADTLAADLTAAEPLKFDIGQFQSGQFFGEWNIQFGNHIEIGAGVGYYRSPVVTSTYRNLVNVGGSEIRQNLQLRIVPITGIVRWLPFGSARTVQPYLGGGGGSFTWRYTESGQFVNTSDNSIFSDQFAAHGTSAGLLLLGGLRIPTGDDALAVEWRYQFGVGNTGGVPAGFLGDKIDLGGGTLCIGFLGRF